MALVVRGSRLITVDGTVYRWRLRRKPTYNQECFDTPLTFAVELADSGGSVLAVSIPDVSHPGSLIAKSSLIVRPALVAAVIQLALGRGWQPAAAGAPFVLNVASGDLPAEVKTEMIPGKSSRLLRPARPARRRLVLHRRQRGRPLSAALAGRGPAPDRHPGDRQDERRREGEEPR